MLIITKTHTERASKKTAGFITLQTNKNNIEGFANEKVYSLTNASVLDSHLCAVGQFRVCLLYI